jgi:hypothetical protein
MKSSNANHLPPKTSFKDTRQKYRTLGQSRLKDLEIHLDRFVIIIFR